MSAAVTLADEPGCRPVAAVAPARIALLGTGTVGRALLARLDGWAGTSRGDRLSLVYVANSRAAVHREAGLCPRSMASTNPDPPVGHRLPRGDGQRACASDLDGVAEVLGDRATRIVIDATASEAVAERHARWLAQGIHVVTACKLGQGTSQARWRAIQSACARGDTGYGDSATVGAGLPLLRCIRELQAGGDRIHAIAGVLSGSLAWLFHHFDGLRSFSSLVREARAAGYAEPDPREDLSGEDVRRKLLILARVAGMVLDERDVAVESLLLPRFAGLSPAQADAALPGLDARLRARHGEARRAGRRLHFVARIARGAGGAATARVGLEALAGDHPLAGGAGTDNRVAIWSDRYREQPLLIQGPGAGAGVTAAALLDDALRITGRWR